MSKKENFPKRNELVQLKGNSLSIFAHKTFDFIYKSGLDYYENKRDGGIFELNIYEIKKEIGMNVTSDHSQLIKELKAIEEVTFETYDKKYYESFPLLAGFNIKDNGTLEVALSPFLIRLVFDEKPYYHMSNLLDSRGLKSKYSKRMLDLIKRYNHCIPEYDILKFQDVMDYPNTYRTNDIKIKVLEKMQQELKDNNNIQVEWQIKKIGTKWKSIKFTTEKILKLAEVDKTQLRPTKDKFSDKILKAMKEAKKNIHVRLSTKSVEVVLRSYSEDIVVLALKEIGKYNKEIQSFSALLKASCQDIKESREVTKDKAVAPAVEKIESAPFEVSQEQWEQQTFKTKVTKAEYEKLYKEYLKNNKLKDIKSVRISYDAMSKNKFDIIDVSNMIEDIDKPFRVDEMELYLHAPTVEKKEKVKKDHTTQDNANKLENIATLLNKLGEDGTATLEAILKSITDYRKKDQ